MSLQQISLPTGLLAVETLQTRMPFDALLGFAARANARRGFLFLSKVLGKHWPVRPAHMLAIHHDLASRIAPDLPQPVLFIALAETAIGLGQGVFEAWLGQQATPDPAHADAATGNQTPGMALALFLHSSRYRVGHGELIEFAEAHSHAPRQFLHVPTDPALAAVLAGARSLVLVDDEASTGNTFVNLVQVLHRHCPQLARVHVAVITDFMGETGRSALATRIGLPLQIDATLRGQFQFTPGQLQDAPDAAQRFDANGDNGASGDFGRLGIAHALGHGSQRHAAACAAGDATGDAWSTADAVRVATGSALPAPPETAPATAAANIPCGTAAAANTPCSATLQALAARLRTQIAPGERVLVLGTGEFMHPAFLLAQLLENAGLDIRVQATTRSPILQWGAVSSRLQFPDNYGEGIANYLYNVTPGQYRHVLICHETPANAALLQLAGLLQARLFLFLSEDSIEEIPVC